MANRYTLVLPKWMLKKWWLVAYKIPPDLRGKFKELHEFEPDERFEALLTKYVAAALEGKEVPEAIAPAILNLTNDVLSGREMMIRTGDYISLQAFARQGG